MIYSSLEETAQKVELAVEWRAFELRPEEARSQFDAEWTKEKKKRIEAHWPQVERVARESYGLTLKQGLWGIDTRLAHIGAKVARDAGRADEYHKRVFEAHWTEQKDISNVETLTELATSLGIEREAFEQGLADEELKAEVLGEEMGARQIGLSGVPAVVIANRYLLSGAQPTERLVGIFKEYAEKGSINGQ